MGKKDEEAIEVGKKMEKRRNLGGEQTRFSFPCFFFFLVLFSLVDRFFHIRIMNRILLMNMLIVIYRFIKFVGSSFV